MNTLYRITNKETGILIGMVIQFEGAEWVNLILPSFTTRYQWPYEAINAAEKHYAHYGTKITVTSTDNHIEPDNIAMKMISKEIRSEVTSTALEITINLLNDGMWNYSVRDKVTGIGYVGVAHSWKAASTAVESRVVEYLECEGLA